MKKFILTLLVTTSTLSATEIDQKYVEYSAIVQCSTFYDQKIKDLENFFDNHQINFVLKGLHVSKINSSSR